MPFHRHDDVGLLPVTEVPASAVMRLAGPSITLALGEATGHAQVATGTISLWSTADQDYLVVKDQPARLVHEEHGLQVIEPGVYEIHSEQDFDLSGEWRTVVD